MKYGSLNMLLNEGVTTFGRKILTYPAGAVGGLAGGVAGALGGLAVGPQLYAPKVAYAVSDALRGKDESIPRLLGRTGASIIGSGLGAAVGVPIGVVKGAYHGARVGAKKAFGTIDPDSNYEISKDKEYMGFINDTNKELSKYYDCKHGMRLKPHKV